MPELMIDIKYVETDNLTARYDSNTPPSVLFNSPQSWQTYVLAVLIISETVVPSPLA